MVDQAYIQALRDELTALEAEMSTPEVASDGKKLRVVTTRYARQKKLLSTANRVFELQTTIADGEELAKSDDEEMRLMAEEEAAAAREELPAAELALKMFLLPPDEREGRPVIVEIRAGTGGDEAALFAGDLHRMYTRFAELSGWKVEMIEASLGAIGGYKEIIFSITGDDAFSKMKFEGGVHRVQRVPETESQGRVHTSAATVAVLAEAEDVELDIKEADLRVDYFRSSGPGGQSVNTTDSAVRLTYLPTGTVVTCQDEKSQHRNKEKAMRVLKARVLEDMRLKEAEKQNSERSSLVKSGDRSERIRTYNFPQNRLSDHRINLTLYSLDKIMEGAIDELCDSLNQHDVEERMKEQMGDDESGE